MELQPSETNEGAKNSRQAFLVKILLILLLLLAFPLAWRWTPLGEWINVAAVIDWQQSVKNYPAAFYLVVGAYLLGSLVLFPVTILNVATVFTFGPILGNVYALGRLAGQRGNGVWHRADDRRQNAASAGPCMA